MADPTETFPTLRTELHAALEVVNKNLGGLQILASTPLTGPSAAQIGTAIDSRRRRRNLIQQVLADLDQLGADWGALLDDGYPTLAPIPVLKVVFQELQDELVVLEAAIAQFPLSAPETVVFNPETAVKD